MNQTPKFTSTKTLNNWVYFNIYEQISEEIKDNQRYFNHENFQQKHLLTHPFKIMLTATLSKLY